MQEAIIPRSMRCIVLQDVFFYVQIKRSRVTKLFDFGGEQSSSQLYSKEHMQKMTLLTKVKLQ